METTPVIFRTWRDGGVIALFPAEPGTRDSWTCMSYEHMGQHSWADCGGVIRATRPAKPEEIEPLARELTSLGYNLKLYRRETPEHRAARQAALSK